MSESEPTPEQAPSTALAKLAFDLGPLVVFFAVNGLYGIFPATAAFMCAIILALVGSRLLLGKISPMPIVTAVLVMVFGALTLYLQDETFIKMKPTVLYVLFAVLLLAGLAFKRLFLQLLMGEAFQMTDEGWRIMTFRWVGFFICLAVLNEIIWRSMSTDFWVAFKLFGLLPLTLLFAALQVGLMRKHALDPEK